MRAGPWGTAVQFFHKNKKASRGMVACFFQKEMECMYTAALAMEECAVVLFNYSLEALLFNRSWAMSSMRTPARMLCCCR